MDVRTMDRGGRGWPGRLRAAAVAALAALLTALGGPSVAAASVPVPSYMFVHDPSMIREGNTWYLFSTGDPNGGVNDGDIQIRVSTDLRTWRLAGTVFDNIPAWITNRIPGVQNLWAPDISYFDGLYHLYYAASSFGSNDSVIALATTPTLDQSAPAYGWKDDGLVFSSTSADSYNAIDPALVAGPTGTKWLVFGSFWSGVKILALSPSTGLPASAHPPIYALASAPAPDPEEGAYMVHHAGYYYLFVSYGYCCRAIGSTYEILVGRSAFITGPFLDPNGTAMTNGGGMELQGSTDGMIGPGGPSVTMDAGAYLIVYHYYDAWAAGQPWAQVRRLYWSSDGWPITGAALVPVPGAPPGS
ncbi:MAG: arabinan endo-1,5-alpha-L-arabinosidase [Acidimicrobiales bacterium]|jgi:arabinan endo-1,5-alpha-L-arabinosidase